MFGVKTEQGLVGQAARSVAGSGHFNPIGQCELLGSDVHRLLGVGVLAARVGSTS